MKSHSSWSALILTLPTKSATERMRFWRALKAMGCGVLRDGVYVLPISDSRDLALSELADGIVAADGTAHLVHLTSRDATQEASFRNLFDRDAEYSEFVKSLGAARKSLGRLSTSETNRLIQRLRREHNALLAIDFFPNDASRHAEIDWLDFVSIVDTVLALDEPRAADGVIPRQSLDDYQGKSWATRQHLWVDRVCSAWLIRRFIDPKARFVWLKKPADCPKKAIGFDFDGATFTHVGNRVTFEILLASFGFARDTALTHLGEMVRALDVGGGVVPEAPGFEAVLTGARQRHPNDDALLDETGLVLDSLYIHFSGLTRGRKKK